MTAAKCHHKILFISPRFFSFSPFSLFPQLETPSIFSMSLLLPFPSRAVAISPRRICRKRRFDQRMEAVTEEN
ncbi:hypothetical protein I3842_13G103100 [Carya illinoinensis]|uniref:Uncharacterized protein n=1 Tax=Carya illinoinensis TaxID=32201 RepID=A0A922D6M4_CARIL|nr:hypothetical protein I3842_13G103100 [Carya illinoinensis]